MELLHFENDKYIFKCTPLYKGLFDDYDVTLKEFIEDYREYENSLSCDAYRKFMNDLKRMISVSLNKVCK